MCVANAVPELTMAALQTRVKDAILGHLANGATGPIELLDALGQQYSDYQLKEALLRLLRDGAVVMTSDRKLKLVEAA
jgi:hypothetical protein